MKDRQHGKRKYCMVNSWEKQRGCKIKGSGSCWKQVSWNGKLRALEKMQWKMALTPGRVPSMQALQGESWKRYPCCQFVFSLSWKPVQEATLQNWKRSTLAPVQETWDRCEVKWVSHQPEPVLHNVKCKIPWGFAIQEEIEWKEHRRPDNLVIYKEKRECKIIDIAVPGDQNIKVKEIEKITKYQDLRLQLQKLWNVKASVIPVVVGALGTASEVRTI